MAAAEQLEVGGRTVRLSNPAKVLYPSTGTTKREVVDYYLEVADALLPHVAGRPVTRKRWVDGVGTARKPGQVFFQKQVERGAPEWLQTVEIQHTEGAKAYPLASEPAALAWMANLAALELHVPQWRADAGHGASVDSERQHPDRLVLDLDPGEGADLDDCAWLALEVRELLEEIGLQPVPLTSGSKGIHVYARLDGSLTSRQVSDVAKQLARSLAELHPDRVVSEMAKAKRRGRVMVDWSQNSAAKTTVAPYSLRGRVRPTVAAPRTWEEIERGGLEQLEMADVLRRLERDGDLIAALDPPPDRLARYRSMRSAERTPEPVPEAPSRDRGQRTFVIQEHRARAKHHDVRLEHDGVLVSWAVPKGPPTTPEQNRLAVQTEDHPVEYGEFEGTIPKGEYGAGTVRIWDAGTYELEKWRDDEVIAVLHGREGGGLGGEPYRCALIRTDADKRQWLLHRMQEQAAGGGVRAKRARPKPSPRAKPKAPSGGRRASSRELRPMLASAAEPRDVEDEREWSFEVKWDGWRAIVEVDGGDVRLTSRSGTDLTPLFPELPAAVAEAVTADRAVLDGEIVVLGRQGASDFAALQARAGLTAREARRAAERTPVTLLLFDALEVDGERLLAERLDDRQGRLDAIVEPSRRVRLSTPLRGSLAHILEVTRERGLEGVIAKRVDSRYRPAARSRDWLKLKHQRMAEVAVVGWLEGRGGLAGTVGSLVLARPVGRRLRYVGRVGTGFSAAERERLRSSLRPRRTTPPIDGVPADVAGRVHWVRAVIGEVEHSEETASGALRHPVWRALRPDKSLRDL